MPLFAAIVRMGKLRAGGGERVLQRVLGAPRSRNQERDLYRIPLRLRPDRPSFDDRFQLRGNHTDLEESAQEGRLDFFFFNPLQEMEIFSQNRLFLRYLVVLRNPLLSILRKIRILFSRKKQRLLPELFPERLYFFPLRNDKKKKSYK